MVSFKTLFSLGLIYLASVNASPSSPSSYGYRPGCGQVNVIFTGLPPNHPLVAAQGFNPDQVNAALRQDAANVIKAGYNLRVTLFGPDQSTDVLKKDLKGVFWQVTGVGYGVRGSRVPELTYQFTDTIQIYRERVPFAPTLFNFSPNTTLTVLQKYIPLSSDCANSPGKNLGFDIYCSVCNSTSSSAAPSPTAT